MRKTRMMKYGFLDPKGSLFSLNAHGQMVEENIEEIVITLLAIPEDEYATIMGKHAHLIKRIINTWYHKIPEYWNRLCAENEKNRRLKALLTECATAMLPAMINVVDFMELRQRIIKELES